METASSSAAASSSVSAQESAPTALVSAASVKQSNAVSGIPDADEPDVDSGSNEDNQTDGLPPQARDVSGIDGAKAEGSRGHKIEDRPFVSPKDSTPPPPLDHERIDKAEAFLLNRDIRDVSDADKRAYLRSKAGMMPEEIEAAMDRVARRGAMIVADDSYARGHIRPREREHRDHGQSSQPYYEDRDSDRQDGIRRRVPNEYYRDDSGNVRRPPSSNYPPENYNDMPTYMQSAPGAEREGTASSSSFLPAWAGGFSLGIFCLAAFRWLNGGDFVLFPPPTATESGTLGSEKGGLPSSINEGGTDETCSKQHEDDNLQGGDFKYEEVEGSDGDDRLDMILDGTTTNSQNLHPDETQPSLNELLLEMRSLTSAVHSYRDVQERANRAMTAQVGKGMTDDAMGFLREKISEASPAREAEAPDINEKMASITFLLTEVSGCLSLLAKGILQEQKGEDKPAQPAENSDIAEQPSEGEREDRLPSKQIAEAMEKIQRVVDMVQSIDPPETERQGSGDIKTNVSVSVEKQNKASAEVASETAAGTGISQQGEKSSQHQTIHAEQTDKVEAALNKLLNNNEAQECKAGAQMLYLYLLNITKNPSVPRYRKIYVNNNNFRNKVGNLTGAKELLSAVGFAERATFFEWAQPDDEATKSRLESALESLERMKSGAKSKDGPIVSPSDPTEIPTGSTEPLLHAAASVSDQKDS